MAQGVWTCGASSIPSFTASRGDEGAKAGHLDRFEGLRQRPVRHAANPLNRGSTSENKSIVSLKETRELLKRQAYNCLDCRRVARI